MGDLRYLGVSDRYQRANSPHISWLEWKFTNFNEQNPRQYSEIKLQERFNLGCAVRGPQRPHYDNFKKLNTNKCFWNFRGSLSEKSMKCIGPKNRNCRNDSNIPPSYPPRPGHCRDRCLPALHFILAQAPVRHTQCPALVQSLADGFECRRPRLCIRWPVTQDRGSPAHDAGDQLCRRTGWPAWTLWRDAARQGLVLLPRHIRACCCAPDRACRAVGGAFRLEAARRPTQWPQVGSDVSSHRQQRLSKRPNCGSVPSDGA